MTRRRDTPPIQRLLIALTVIHPVPSAINAILVAVLASIAGAGPTTAGSLAIGMLGFQFSIGALNDIADADADADREPPKPIPAGLVSVPTAVAIVVVGAAVGLVISASFTVVVLILGALGYGTGVAYDIGMRRRGLGWLCYAAAFPLLMVWTWVAAASSLPPGWPLLLPVAALSGPALHLANSLVDVDSDSRAGSLSLATRLGPRRAVWTLAGLMATIVILAWTTLLIIEPVPSLAIAAGLMATITIAVGVALSGQERARTREAGWLLQAVGLATIAAAWLASMAAR